MIVFKLLLMVTWIYLLSVFHRGKLEFFKFLFGSVGTFFIIFNFVPYIKQPIISFFTYLLGLIGNFTNLFEGYAQYGMFFINHNDTVMSLYIDLECSGLIEIMVFLSLIAFFPVYNWKEKIKVGVTGCVFIYLFNFIRIISIILLIYQFGSPMYAFAHSIVGRLIFYVCIVILYFYIFTKAQISKQKIGKFDYDAINKEKK